MMGAVVGGCAEPKQRHSQVNEQFNEMDGAIDRLRKLVDALEEKTAPVVRAEDPVNAACGTMAEEILVPLAENIRCFRRSVHHVSNRIESILARIEL